MGAFHPNCAWSWMVLLAGICAFGIGAGLMLSYGVYYVTYIQAFGATNSQATMVGSLAYGCFLMSGLIGGFLGTQIGHARVVFIGGTVATIGYLASAFVPTIHTLAVAQAIVGAALGLLIPSVVAVQTSWFIRFRFLAVGLVTVGGAIGVFLFPPFFVTAITIYGWRGSMLLNAGVALQLYICAVVMRPTPKTGGSDGGEDERKVTRMSAVRSLWTDVRSIGRSMPFWLLFAASWCAFGACYTYYSLANAFMISRGLTVETSALMISASAVTSFLGRVAAALLGQTDFIPKTALLTAGYSVACVAILSALGCYDLWHFVCVNCLFGFGFGTLIASSAQAIMAIFGAEQLGNVQGLITSGAGMGIFTVPPLAGWLIDRQHGSLAPAFVLAGGVMAAAVVLAVAVTVWTRRPISDDGHHPIRVQDEVVRMEDCDTDILTIENVGIITAVDDGSIQM